MSRKKWYLVMAAMAVAALTLGLVFGLTAGQQQGIQSTQVRQVSQPAAGIPSEGIQVHGRWTIDVLNPDGALVQHLQFENTLTYDATGLLSDVLAADRTPGPWAIYLYAPDISQSPFTASDGNRYQFGGIYEPRDVSNNYMVQPANWNYCAFPNLTVTSEYDPSSCGLKLKGYATAQVDGKITQVQTGETICISSASPDTCTTSLTACSSPYVPFTTKDLDTPCPLNAGQQVMVEVDISFQ